uniref:Phage neck terminator protein gp12-like domain-containing protein n=4 Tax=unclassified bacterial viruses TaxID=12333 RepID=A0AAU6W3E5_9VIRU
MNIDTAIVSVADFLQSLMPTQTQIVRGQANGVPAPLAPSVVITEIGMPQYTTTRSKLNSLTNQMTYLMPVKLRLQLDFYGAQAGEMATIAQTLLRSHYGPENFPDGVEPLYCTDGFQAPLTTAEKQYEARWSMELWLQYNAPVTVGQESFSIVGSVIVDPVDETIPAE